MCDHLLSQRNRTTERTMGVGLEITKKWEGLGQNLKKEQVGNIGGLHKLGGLAPLYQLCKETLKTSHTLL